MDFELKIYPEISNFQNLMQWSMSSGYFSIPTSIKIVNLLRKLKLFTEPATLVLTLIHDVGFQFKIMNCNKLTHLIQLLGYKIGHRRQGHLSRIADAVHGSPPMTKVKNLQVTPFCVMILEVCTELGCHKNGDDKVGTGARAQIIEWALF